MSVVFKLNKRQLEYISSKKANTGFVAGLGSGKSYVATLKTIMMKVNNPKLTVAYYLPTYALVRDIAFDKFPEMLEDMGYKFTLNKSDKEIHIQDAGKIIFRSMDNPQNIVGYEVFFSVIDECDILPLEKMTIAYNKIMARNRQKHPDSVANGLDVVGTPEGFKWFYKRFVKNFNEDTDLLVRATTYENKHLPDDYIDNLRQQYPPNLIEAYLNGIFINLATGTIYSYYNQQQHETNEEIQNNDVLHISQDFNTGGCASVVYKYISGIPYAVDEFLSDDTFKLIKNINMRYGSDRSVVMYPDASGASNKTSAQKSDIKLLKEAGFKVKAKGKNPYVKDRIQATNMLLSKDMMYVNSRKCPNFSEALQQHSYDEKGEPEKFNGGGTVDDWTDGGTYLIAYNHPLTHIKGISTTRR